MAVVINTNVDAIKIRGNLNTSTSSMEKSMQRMSSGLKIISAKDDAAGTVISARMKVQLDGNTVCQNNVQNGNAMLATVEGNIDVVLDNVSRIRDLTLQAKNGTYSEEEIQAMQDEVEERIAEIDRVSTSSKFSQLYLFEDIDPKTGKAKTGDDDKGSLQKAGATFQVGANSADDNTIKVDSKLFASVNFSSLIGLNETKKSKTAATFDLTEMKKAGGDDSEDDLTYQTALDKLDSAIDNLTERKSLIGSAENRLDSALETLTTQFENLSSAKSIITDADVAAEASDFTQNQILQQVATSLLAQANQAPAIALSLI